MNTRKDIMLRVYLLFFVFVVMGVLVTGQIFKLQFIKGSYYRSLSDSLTTIYATIEPIRGNIYSADNKLLVTSLLKYELRVDFKTYAWKDNAYYNTNVDSFCIKMSQLFKDRTYRQYKADISRARQKQERYYLLKRNVNHIQLKKAKQLPFFNKGRYQGGLIAEQRSKRIYPFGTLAERTLGYKVKHLTGVGLEGAFNEYLEGKSGRRLMQKISGGNWIPINYENELEPEDGKDIITTIDINIQDAAEESLLKALVEHDADNGTAIVMEVKTGYIRAIANLKKNTEGKYAETYNYAVGASTEPGSTFKLASAIALLEKGIVKPSTLVDTKDGTFQFFDRTMRDASSNGFGVITFKRAFEVSSNVAFSRLVFENFSKNPEDFIHQLVNLHITEPLGFQIAGEGKPVFKYPGDKNWSGTTLPWMSVGYELQITPLQLLTLYNAVANNGKMMKPVFVTQVKKVGKEIENFEPIVLDKKICSQKTLDYLIPMMKGVVENGTAKNIFTPKYQIAGKTGTSLVASEGSYSKKKTYQSSFAGFFPADNPKYSCIIVITNPKSGSVYGAFVAAPVFKNIAEKIYTTQHVPFYAKKYSPNYSHLDFVKYGNKNDLVVISSILGIDMKMNGQAGDWVYAVPSKKEISLYPKTIEPKKIPDVRGMVLSDALYLLENLGLTVEFKGTGLVASQSLKAGTPIEQNTLIKLKLRS